MTAAQARRYRAVELDGDFTVGTTPGYVENALHRFDPVDASERAEEEAFKVAMRALSAGVVMVTTEIGDRPWGLTISSCCSLTLKPPRLLVCLGTATTSWKEIEQRDCFGVSVLGEQHKALAELGAAVGQAKFMDDFCESGIRRGSPMIKGALAHLDCSVASSLRIGDHAVVIGTVTNACIAANAAAPPLLYFDRAFWSLGAELD
jgi:flavin reductase ActVB